MPGVSRRGAIRSRLSTLAHGPRGREMLKVVES